MANLLPDDYDRQKARKLENEGTHFARTCYDHLAGQLGVAITAAMLKKGILNPGADRFVITAQGAAWFSNYGIELNKLQDRRRVLLHQCLDWTEKEHHLGGALGSAFLEMMLKNDWIRKKQQSREVLLTGKGRFELQQQLDIYF